MSDDIKRKTSGQFAHGQSGNPAGARRRRHRGVLTLADMHNTILEVASRETEAMVDGKPTRVTMFKVNVLRQASGAPGSRHKGGDFIDLAKNSAHWAERERKAEEERRRKAGRTP